MVVVVVKARTLIEFAWRLLVDGLMVITRFTICFDVTVNSGSHDSWKGGENLALGSHV